MLTAQQWPTSTRSEPILFQFESKTDKSPEYNKLNTNFVYHLWCNWSIIVILWPAFYKLFLMSENSQEPLKSKYPLGFLLWKFSL